MIWQWFKDFILGTTVIKLPECYGTKDVHIVMHYMESGCCDCPYREKCQDEADKN